MSATQQTGEHQSIWNRLTEAERGALALMRNGKFLYRRKGNFSAVGADRRVKLATVRNLRSKLLVQDQPHHKDNPLMLTERGVAVLATGEGGANERKLKAEREAVITSAKRAYQEAMTECAHCIGGYTSACPTPDTCISPQTGCAHCIQRCTACDQERLDA